MIRVYETILTSNEEEGGSSGLASSDWTIPSTEIAKLWNRFLSRRDKRFVFPATRLLRMANHSKYLLDLVREGVEFTLYRGTERDSRIPILAVVAAAELPSPQSLRRLEQEYALASQLDAAWAVLPLALTRHQGQAALIFKDPGGEVLDWLIEQRGGQPIDLTRFLRVAIGLSSALSHVHRQGLIHKDIKPANLIVDSSDHVWLTGFGIASQLPRERQPLAPPEFIAGSLPYMAPEQTGRMNRSIDSRSDLYSLGVTLYEFSTGALPFTASDPMEWVHCQIARQAAPPCELAPTIPAPVSAIIMKLIAKTTEERYQTAAGLERDLQRCLNEWETHAQIDAFPLGEHDKSDRLLIPEKLYGRASEIDVLLGSFERVVSGGRPELVLVSGYSGVGKSSVVNELHKSLVPPRGVFASGKFDQYKRDIPYATLAQALQSLLRAILGKNEEELAYWREAFREALGPNGQIMVDLVPELKLIVGEQNPVPELPPQDAQSRFQMVFRRLIGAFTRLHPLVLFLDDLQWLDSATLDLMEDLLTHPEVKDLMLIGAYRDNEVGPTHSLIRKLEAVRKNGAIVHDVVLAPLLRHDLEELVADSLHCERQHAETLAELIEHKTAGNPFFVIQFLSALFEEGLITFDHIEARWCWELPRIQSKGYTDNVVTLMVEKINRLPIATQKALQQLACLGNTADFVMLEMVYQEQSEELHRQLWEAMRTGLIFQSEGSYNFLHDRVQEAAYSLIPQELRAGAHRHIGMLMASSISQEQLEETIFEIVNQLNRGSHLITDARERSQTANLNYIAGKKAKASTAYHSSLKYLHAARSLLGAQAWKHDYDLFFSIESLIAECELHTADMAAAELRLNMLAQHSKNRPHDFAMVTRLQITLYTTLDRSDHAIEVFLDYLRRSGTVWSKHPTRDDVMQEYNRIWAHVSTRQIEELIDLPLLDDPDVLDMLDVFTEIVHPAMFFDENFSTLVVCRMVNLCLEHGNSDASCFGYVWFGMFAGPRFNNYRDGFRFGQLGYDLVEKRRMTRYQARTYISFGTLTPWAKHALKGRELVRRAFDVAYQTGDLTFSAYSWHELITNYLAVGDPLSEVRSEAEKGLDFVKKAGFGLVAENCGAQLALVRTLRGETASFGRFDTHDYNERDTENRLASNPVLALAEFFYWTRKLQARFFAGDFISAVEASRRAHQLLWPAASQVETGEFRFFAALAHAAAWNSASSEERPTHLSALNDHHRQLEIWTQHCPENFENKTALVRAEIARIEGRILDAEYFYEAAIRSAHQNGFVHWEALANECTAEFYSARGLAKIAHVYLRDARGCYLLWGATGKVKQLEEQHPVLLTSRTPVFSGTPESSDGQLDVETVVKASQALSSEIVLPKLIEKLIQIAVENAGADRGLLILIRSGKPQIEAEATAAPARIEVAVHEKPVTSSDLPQTVLHFVMRTQQSVLMDDASTDNLYFKDEYIARKRSKSVLCMPIVKQANLVGILYLENSLTSGAFARNRVIVLELLAAQAAISLENAILYTDLQLQVGLLQHLPASVWTLKPNGTPDFVNRVWLEFAGHTLEVVRSHPEAWMSAVHPEDREIAVKSFWEGVNSGQGFAMETRNLRAQDQTYRWHLQQAVVLRDFEGRILRFVGTTTDIDDQKRIEETLRQAQSDLARINRATTMGELTASLAHELRQPISGVMINANVCLRWLEGDQPDLEKVREAAGRIVRDTQRAADIIARTRAQFEKDTANRAPVDINEITRETIALLRDESMRNKILVRTELTAGLPQVLGDRVLLQQVAMNLIINSIEAMKEVEGLREIAINSRRAENGHILVAISDTGPGLQPHQAERIFDSFFTTKPNGTGMGLRISRSIIESHGGRLWAASAAEQGAIFQFTLQPIAAEVCANPREPIL
jgi:PAS domain S-box-containing protein